MRQQGKDVTVAVAFRGLRQGLFSILSRKALSPQSLQFGALRGVVV